MQCTKCGQPVEAGATFCGNCGQPVAAATPPLSVPPPAVSGSNSVTPAPAVVAPAANVAPNVPPAAVAPPLQAQPYTAASSQGSSGGLAIAGFVLSLLTIPGILFSFLNLLGCILAIVFSIIGLKSARRSLAKAGIVIGTIGILGTIGYTAFIVQFAAKHANDPATQSQTQNPSSGTGTPGTSAP